MTDQDFTLPTGLPVASENALKYADKILARIESIHELNKHFENYPVDIDVEEVRSHTLCYIEKLTTELRFALDMARGDQCTSTI